LVGAAGLAAGGWSLWQQSSQGDLEQRLLSRLELQAREQTDALGRRERALTERLAQLPSADEQAERRRLLSDLQGDQQRLNQRLETLLGASRQDWRLAEAEHLLRLASLRLSALQDINSATALVQGADEILREQDDPAAYAAREQLARSLEALRSLPQPDRTGLFLQLGALREQALQLRPLNPSFAETRDEPAPAEEGEGYWTRWWHKLSGFVRIEFDATSEVRPLLAGQSLEQVRLALGLALEQAQWAALHGESAVYRQALGQARDLLESQFDQDNIDSRALRARLGELAELPVRVATPDLSPALNALQAYLQRRQTATGQAADELLPEVEAPAP
jgi:uncharacterized protein HemX